MAPGSAEEQPVTGGLRLAASQPVLKRNRGSFFRAKNDAVKLAKALRAALHRINVGHG
jgi:hypothetical protein